MARGYEVDPKSMSFLAHLRELRKVLIHSAVAVLAATAAAWGFSGRLLDLLLETLALEDVQFLGPLEPFHARFQVALTVGLCVSLPVVAFRFWAFVVPALRAQERRVILPSAIATAVLFGAGAMFSLTVLTPMMLDLLLGFGTKHARPDLALGPVLSFVFRMTLAAALLFQLPLVLALTTLLGATTPKQLLSWWRYAVVAIFILAAVATPGDGPSQIVLAVPLVALYFVSVLISWGIARGRGRALSAPSAPPGGPAPVTPRAPPPGTAPRGDDSPANKEGDQVE